MIIDLSKKYGITSFNNDKLIAVGEGNVYRMNMDGKDAFIKNLPDFEKLYSELIGAEILDILNIPRAKIALGLINNHKVIISFACYDKEEEFISGASLFRMFYDNNKIDVDGYPDFYGGPERDYPYERFNNLHSIWGVLEWYIKKNGIKDVFLPELLNSLIQQALFVWINDIVDFHADNWGVLHKNSTLSIYPRFDNELFDNYFYDDELIYDRGNMSVYMNDRMNCSDTILTNFLSVSDDTYVQTAIDMVDKLLSIGVSNILSTVETKWGITIRDKEIFILKYQERLDSARFLLTYIQNKRFKKAV